MTINDAAAEVLDAGGFPVLAERHVCRPKAAFALAMRMSSGEQRNTLQKAQRLVGKPSLDVRHYVETGKKRYNQE